MFNSVFSSISILVRMKCPLKSRKIQKNLLKFCTTLTALRGLVYSQCVCFGLSLGLNLVLVMVMHVAVRVKGQFLVVLMAGALPVFNSIV